MDEPNEETAFEPLSEDELALLQTFQSVGVQHVVVGGYAARVHGHFRGVEDLDLVVDTSSRNLELLERALTELGVSNASAVRSHFQTKVDARWDWQEAGHDHCVDLLARVHNFRFGDLVVDAVPVNQHGLRLLVISRAKLIAVKDAVAADPGRGEKAIQDREDLAFLMRGAVEQ